MLISFWSSHHGQTGSTSNLISLSLTMALNNNLKTLVSHSQYGETQLERALVPDIDNYIGNTLCNYGLEPVLRLAKNALLIADNFSDYTIPLIKNNYYDLLAGVRKKQDNKQELNSYEDTIIKVLEMAKEKYDLVFIDLASGFINDLSKKIIDISELVVININQNHYVLDTLKNSDFINSIENKSIYCIGKYDDRVKSNAKNIARKYKLKNLITVPYEAQFIDVINRGETVELFGRNLVGKNSRKQSDFFKNLIKSSDEMLKYAKKIQKNSVKNKFL